MPVLATILDFVSKVESVVILPLALMNDSAKIPLLLVNVFVFSVSSVILTVLNILIGLLKVTSLVLNCSLPFN